MTIARLVVLLLILTMSLHACSGGDGTGGGGGSSTPTTAASFGVIGNNYSTTLPTGTGTPPFTWSLVGGSLPPGLILNSATGAVTGTPTSAGNFIATISVKDSTGQPTTSSVLFAIHTRTDRISVDNSGITANGASSAPSISGDGSLVAVVSQAANLVAGVNGTQIYVHNRQTNQVELASRDSNTSVLKGNGTSSQPVISTDGRFVAFVSQSTNLVPGVSVAPQLYLRDRQTGQTSLVSRATNGVISDGTVNGAPSISSDGQFIAFVSNATNLVAGVSGQQIYLRDTIAGTTTLISKNNNPTPLFGDAASDEPSINSDGQFIAFSSFAKNFATVAGSSHQIFIHDRLAGANGTTSLISQDSGGNSGNGNSSAPSVSGDGRFVAFWSLATNLVVGPTGQQIYVHDRNTGLNGTNSLVSRDFTVPTQGGNQDSSDPSISLNGQVVTFVSLATNLISGISGQQVYTRDLPSGTTALVSRDNSLGLIAGSGVSTSPSASSDGSFVAFSSTSTNLVPVPPAAPSDIYVRAMP